MFYFNSENIKRPRQKDRWKATIFNKIFSEKKVSRKEIVEECDLRRETVATAVQELIEDRLVFQGEPRNSGKPGRPEYILIPNVNRLAVISIYYDIEERMLRGVLINLADEIIAKQEAYLEKNTDNQIFNEILLDFINNLQIQKPMEADILGAGMSLTGSIDIASKKWISSIYWPKLRNFCFGQIEKELQINIKLEKLLNKEMEFLLLKNPGFSSENILLFYWGFNIGSAYSHKGMILHSNFGRFAAIGHMLASHKSNKPCICGFKGCLETEAAIWALLPQIRKVYPNIQEDGRNLIELYKIADFYELPCITKALEYVKDNLVNCFRIFFPDRIIFIGHFAEHEEIFNRLTHSFRHSLPEELMNKVSIDIIHGGFRGCLYANAYPFFNHKLKQLLKARS